jgi:hypothetical protein
LIFFAPEIQSREIRERQRRAKSAGGRNEWQ